MKIIVSAAAAMAAVSALGLFGAGTALAAPDVEGIAGDVYYGPDEGDVLLTLNCNRGVATVTTPGASAASVPGREFAAKAEEAAAAAQNEEDELADAGELPGVPGQVAE